MLLRYVLNDFEYIPGAPFITGVTFVFKILLLSSSSSLTSPNRIIGLSFFLANTFEGPSQVQLWHLSLSNC